MKNLGLIPLTVVKTVIPKVNSGFTHWNLLFYSIMSTGIIPKLYPIIFCTTWGVFVSFNIAPLLYKDAFCCLATTLKIESMIKFHVVYNLIGHCMPCIFLMVFPPKKMYWWSGIVAAGLHLSWGAIVTKGTMLLDKIYIPMRPSFWAVMWSSAVITEIAAPFLLYPLKIKKNNK